MQFLLRALLVIAIVFFWDVSEAEACSCAKNAPPIAELNHADAVFTGQVDYLTVLDGGILIAHLTVDQQWKGRLGEKIDVFTSTNSSATCGFPFDVGEKYLIYAAEAENQLFTNICSRSTLLQYGYADIAAFELEEFEQRGCGGPLVPTVVQTFFWVGLARVIRRSLLIRNA